MGNAEKPNTSYKDSVFSLLFSTPEILRDLYAALSGAPVSPDARVEINTLRNALYRARINDVSFTIDRKLVVLIEHQSTVNPNMALRLLLYIARLYEKMTDNKALYRSKQITIARPEFIVLYNGIEPYPDSAILRLSNLYAAAEIFGGGNPPLELEARVYNINEGRNPDMLVKCAALSGYSVFIKKGREFEQQTGDRAAALRMAIQYCIKHGILAGFLREHGSEVVNMLLEEWDADVAREVAREEGFEEGREAGLEKGLATGLEQGLETAARNALMRGASIDFVRDITGFDTITVRKIAGRAGLL
jgi:predicted transposase YdaD